MSVLIRRYLFPVLIALAIVAFYHLVDVRFFNLGFYKTTRDAYFHLKSFPSVEESIAILNIGKLGQDDLVAKN